MTLRPIVIGAVPLVAFGLLIALFPGGLPRVGEPNQMPMLCAVSVLVWAVVLFYTLWRAPRAMKWHESDSAYRTRVGYREPQAR